MGFVSAEFYFIKYCSKNLNGFFFFKRVKEQLSGLGCPLEMVKTLIENSNKSRLPPGLRSPEARRANWDQLKDYRCRVTLFQFMPETIQMIIIMASDNAHMDQDLFVINPGFVVLSVVPILNCSC